MATIRVRAIGDPEQKKYVGFYNYVRRKPGDVFDLLDEKDFSKKWMKHVDTGTPVTTAPGEPTAAEVAADRARAADKPVALSQAGSRARPATKDVI